jgi:hypothetical protein
MTELEALDLLQDFTHRAGHTVHIQATSQGHPSLKRHILVDLVQHLYQALGSAETALAAGYLEGCLRYLKDAEYWLLRLEHPDDTDPVRWATLTEVTA